MDGPHGFEGEAAREPGDWLAALAVHDHWLRRVVLQRTGEAQAVDEVLQEVGLAASQAATAGGAPASAAAWLYRVAVRQALLYRRRCGRRRKLGERYGQHLAGSGNGNGHAADAPRAYNPLAWLLRQERADLVRAALARLDGRDADVLMLKYTEQWSCRQLAEHLGMTESAIEARLHRARKRLRDELNRLDVNEDAS